MVDTLRADAGSLGLVTALGWYVTKHSIGLYSTEPPGGGFRRESAQPDVDALPKRAVVADHDGSVTIDSFTVSPNPVTGGYNPIGTVSLVLPAPPGGVVVALDSSDRATVPIDASVFMRRTNAPSSSNALVGMHPQFRHVPPRFSFSTHSTRFLS